MSNAQKNTPPVPPGGININGTVENNVVHGNVALARVYHALKEIATMPSAARKKWEAVSKRKLQKTAWQRFCSPSTGW